MGLEYTGSGVEFSGFGGCYEGVVLNRESRYSDFFAKSENNIEALRALAVLSVFAHHAQHVFSVRIPFFGEYGGQFGPQLFFLISGYLISKSAEQHSTGDFFIHRVFRIFSAYLFFFFLFGIKNHLMAWERVQAQPEYLLANLLLLQHLWPKALLYFDSLHVTWTLTVELLWYVLAPLVVARFAAIGPGLLAASIVISTAYVLAAHAGAFNFLIDAGYVPREAKYLFIDNNFLSQLCFFFMGGFVYFQRKKLAGLNAFALGAAAVAVFVFKDLYFVVNPIFITGLGLLCLLAFAVQTPAFRSFWVRLLSDVSYSFYLCHFPVLLFVERTGFKGWAGTGVALVVTVAVSAVAFRLIEKPFIRIGRKLSTGAKRAATP